MPKSKAHEWSREGELERKRDALAETARKLMREYRAICKQIDRLKGEKTRREEDMIRYAKTDVKTKSRPKRERPPRPAAQNGSITRDVMLDEGKIYGQKDFQIGNIGAIRVNTHDIDIQYLITYKGCGFCHCKLHNYEWHVQLYRQKLKGCEFKDMAQTMGAVLETLNGRHA
jgi:hypothetical protein